jgi:catechol 2,3-dioxygenase-like lactoylglutathione lyase family enzyme
MQPVPQWAACLTIGGHPLKINAIDHVSINLADAKRSYDFYGRILGLKRLETVDCGEFDITYFALPNGARLELFDYRGQNSGASRLEHEVGLRHIAFQVQDVAAHETRLRDAGVEITLSTCDLPNLGARVLLFRDPNGVTLELCEPL